MPTRLPASEQLLDAIFAHTNKLRFEDRQYILRFLAGEDSSPPPELDRINENVGHVANSTSYHPIQRAMSLTPITQVEAIAASRLNVDTSSSMRHILLHEEKRTELRPIPCPNDDIPTSFLSVEGAPDGMRSYTILDQIVFEMDYSTGCWRKIRRRMRTAERKHDENEPSTDVPSQQRRSQNNQGQPLNNNTANGEPAVRSVNPRSATNAGPSRMRLNVTASRASTRNNNNSVPLMNVTQTSARSRGTTLGGSATAANVRSAISIDDELIPRLLSAASTSAGHTVSSGR